MEYGPVEMLVVKFPGNEFSGEIVPALEELIETETVRIIDLLFVLKDSDGALMVYEMDAWGDEVAAVSSRSWSPRKNSCPNLTPRAWRAARTQFFRSIADLREQLG